jgi:large subunit ribosomal protein L3
MIKEIFGKKLGMTQIFDNEGNLVGVTVVEIEPACILEKVSYPSKEKVKIGCFRIPENRINKVKKPILGYFKKIELPPYKIIREVDFDSTQEIKAKQEFGVEIFKEGELVDVRARTKGRGFQGGMKRHGWSGQPKSHGSTTHRRIGSAGASTFPARIVKGHRMPGHMGNVIRTIKNIKVLKVDKEKNVLFLKGAVPGSIGCNLLIRKVK